MVQFDPQMVAQILMQPIQRASENLGGAPFGIGADAGGSFFVDPEVAARTGYGTAVTGTSFFPGAGIVDAAGGAVDITGQPLPSFSENIREGQFTDAGLQALGVAGDIATIAAPLTGGATALLGAMMKAPRAAQKVTKATDVAKSTEIRNLPNRVLHGTLVDNVDSIKKLGIVPDVGENVSFSYGEYEDLLKPFSFFSGTDDIDRSLSAIKNQVGIKLGKQASEVTDADIVKHGALVVSRVEDTGSIFRVGEGGETFTLADEKGFFDAPVSGETDDIVSSETVKPSGILTGQKLKKFLENRKLIESTDVASDVAGIAKVEPPTDTQPGIIAFHGSGADFDEFRLDKIGTGEGNQAFGYGLYFSDSEDIGKFYKNAVRFQKKDLELDGKPLDSVNTADNEEKFSKFVKDNFSDEEYDSALTVIDELGQGVSSIQDADEVAAYTLSDRQNAIYKKMKGFLKEPKIPEGKLYKVALEPKVDELLDYDLSLKEQPEKFKKILKPIYEKYSVSEAADFGTLLESVKSMRTIPDDAFMEELSNKGIKGIKYKAGQLSGITDSDATNFVIFDDKLIKILEKYGIVGPVAVSATAAALRDDDGST